LSGRSRLLSSVVALGLFAATLGTKTPAVAEPAGRLRVETVSNRADLVSGGDALIRVVPPRGVGPAGISYAVNGRGVAGALRKDPAGTGYLALAKGLRTGENTITATGGGQTVELKVTNHPIGGPVFAGPQVTPWFCTTEENGLGRPKDKQCNAPTQVRYVYKTNNPQTPFQPYDPAAPPGNVPMTTTDRGVTVPYIVRVERGTLDRSIYEIAVLADPTKDWQPWAPQKAWNHKLHVPFGGGCSAHHRQTIPGGVLDDFALSRGFAVAASGLNTLSQNCNEVVSAEALMMIKERVIETLGTIRYTFGKGASGGSIQQQNIAATYPGLLDGIMPGASYPDVWTTFPELFDCSLLLSYFNEVSPHLWTVGTQRAAVAGHSNVDSACVAWEALFVPAMDPTGAGAFGMNVNDNGCGVPPERRYNPETNPKGVRCAVADYVTSIFGRRKQDGFGKRPLDNVGVQYGLNALNSGLILSEQFVDLNEKIGGFDIDLEHQPQRTTADPGVIEIAYRSGRVTDARQLAKVPMIDLRIPENEEIHQHYYSYTMRARLDRANGTHANQIIWTGGGSDGDAFLLMDKWLRRIESDRSSTPLRLKVIRNKPAEAVDACGIGSSLITDTNACRIAFPYYSNPRIAAGGPFANNVFKCKTKPLDRTDYRVTFSDAQWARLKSAFPTGVCDWNRNGVDQQPVVPWQTYKDGPGGKPLGPRPQSHPVP
jgi:hypothetical protein